MCIRDRRNSCRSTRFRVSLAQLHDEAVGQFAAEISDGGLEPALAVWAGSSIVMLCCAMSEGFELTRNEMSRNADLAHKTVKLIADAGGLIAMPTAPVSLYTSDAADDLTRVD